MTKKPKKRTAGSPRRFARATRSFTDFCTTIAALRHPKTGCPWDLQQSNKSLSRYMVEEAYEATEAMLGDDYARLCEELGDVLLQVVLGAQIAADQKRFTIADVVDHINKKMRRRHPHVFPPKDGSKHSRDLEAIYSTWDKIKDAEKAARGQQKGQSYFAPAKTQGPATLQAAKIGELAHRINFDWPDAASVMRQCQSEMAELQEAMTGPSSALLEEIGDVYFTLAQLCRKLGQSPEVVAFAGNQKFLRRFSTVEKLAKRRGVDIKDTTTEVLESLWQEAKRDLEQNHG